MNRSNKYNKLKLKNCYRNLSIIDQLQKRFELTFSKEILQLIILLLLGLYLGSNFLMTTAAFSSNGFRHLSIFILLSLLLAILNVLLVLRNVLYVIVVSLSILLSFNHMLAPFLVPIIVIVIGKSTYFKLDFTIRLCITALTVFILNFIKTSSVYNPVMHHWKLGLGFSNPNTLGMMSLILLLELYLFKSQMSRLSYYCIGAFLLLILVASDSRTAILLFLLYLLFYRLCSKKYDFIKKSKLITGLISVTPFWGLLVSLFCTYWYKQSNSHLVRILDLETSNRWQQSARFVNWYGYSLFGQHIKSTSGNVLDMGYINLLLQTGIIPTFIILSLLTITIFVLLKRGAFQLYVPFLIMCISGLSETWLSGFTTNPFLACLAVLLVSNREVYRGKITL